MNKKLVSILLTATMVLSSSFIAFADDPTPPSFSGGALGSTHGDDKDANSIDYTGTVELPIINVEIAGSKAGVVANPYGLTVEGVTVDDGEDYPTLIGDVITITNKSNMKIGLGITGKVEPFKSGDKDSQVKIATDPKAMHSDTKNKNVYVEGFIASDAWTAEAKSGGKMAVKGKEVAPVVFTAKGAAFTDPILEAGTKDGDNVTAATFEEDSNTGFGTTGTIKLVIDGETSFPEGAAWEETDTFKVTTTFDIKAANAAPTTFSKVTE